MSKRISRTGYAIADIWPDGEPFLYADVEGSRSVAIHKFCRDMSQAITDTTPNWPDRRMHPVIAAAWKRHRAEGRRCIKVTITGRYP